MKKFELGVIGGGNMANAIISGIVKKCIMPSTHILVSDIDQQKLQYFSDIGTATTSDNVYLLNNCKYVLLAIKPQVAKSVLNSLDFSNVEGLISIMAGVKLKSLFDVTKCPCIARIMPNLPAFVGEAMSAYCFSDEAKSSKSFMQFVVSVFESIGKATLVTEQQMDAVVSVSGSGPAYVFSFIKAMINGGVVGGLTFEQAKSLTLQTFIGATKMVEQSTTELEQLISSVCSKGGTTIEAVKCFEQMGLENIILEGMAKCKARSEELSEEG